eukprot:1482491-Pleurochrysis_carterae.AAC.1
MISDEHTRHAHYAGRINGMASLRTYSADAVVAVCEVAHVVAFFFKSLRTMPLALRARTRALARAHTTVPAEIAPARLSSECEHHHRHQDVMTKGAT